MMYKAMNARPFDHNLSVLNAYLHDPCLPDYCPQDLEGHSLLFTIFDLECLLLNRVTPYVMQRVAYSFSLEPRTSKQ